LDVERDELARFVAGARSDGDDLALLRLLLGIVGMMMPPAVFATGSMRRTRTRSWSGTNCMEFSSGEWKAPQAARARG